MAIGKTNKTKAEGKKKSAAAEAFGRLSNREQTMIYALITLGIVCALYFLLLGPGMDRLSVLEDEVTKAEDTQETYSMAIAQSPTSKEQLATATAVYDEAKGRIFPLMTIETLDSTVTGYLEDAGFDPENLSMSQLESESVEPFIPQPLSESPVQEAVDAQQTEAEAAEDPAAQEEGDEAASEENEDQEAPAADVALYSYSVNINATGGWKNLYSLIDKIAEKDGVELTQYAYSEGSGDSSNKGSFSMTIKFYVFIEGVAAESGEPNAE
jgi:hypothetical protein